MTEALTTTGCADALTGESSSDEINASCSCVDGSHVVEDGAAWEAELKDGSAIGFSLGEPFVLDAGEVEAVVEEAAAAEERADIQLRDLTGTSRPRHAATATARTAAPDSALCGENGLAARAARGALTYP